MSWERIPRSVAGGAFRPSAFMEWATVFGGGIRFSKPAKDRYFGECMFAEIFMDQEANRLAIKPLEQASLNSYRLCPQGDPKKPNWYIGCRAAVKYWNKDLKGRHHCELKQAEDGLVELIPFAEDPKS